MDSKKTILSHRHAYAILAHTDKECLKNLLYLLDDHRNDIYLLIDKKTPKNYEDGLSCTKSKLNIIPFEQRIDTRWGDISMVKAELTLFEAIINSSKEYSYIHLISGQDLPIKSQDEIHNFFEKVPEGSNFIEITDGIINERALKEKTRYYHLFTKYQRVLNNNLFEKTQLLFFKSIRHLSLKFQKIIGYERNWDGTTVAKGIQWVSISQDFTKYLVDNKDLILKRFKGVLIPDEIYKQTMILNSPFNSTVRAFSRKNSDGIRLMDWERGNKIGSPKIYTMSDWEEIDSAYELFARKFSSNIDPEIIKKIRRKLHPNNE